MENGGKGMSRAAKRRRKESLKSGEKNTAEESPTDVKPLEVISVFNEITDNEQNDTVVPGQSILEMLDKVDVVDILAEDRAHALLSIMLAPESRTDFYTQFWQNQPLHIANKKKIKSFANIYSSKDVNAIVDRHILKFSDDIVLGKYYDSEQDYMGDQSSEEEDAAEIGEISGPEVWRACTKGYAFHLYSLQKYNDNIWRLLSSLEHEFNAPINCHLTVTTGHFTGFGPTLADGDEFIFQMEGSEIYNIYGSSLAGAASSSSSASCSATENRSTTDVWPPAIDHHKVVTDRSMLTTPFLTLEMDVGDMIYVPRGWVVEVLRPKDMADKRSAHLTISTNHKNNILALTESIIPQTLLLLEQRGSGVVHSAIASSSSANSTGRNKRLNAAGAASFRSLPRNFLSFMGVARSEEDEDLRREEMRKTFKSVFEVIQEQALDLLDPMADQHAKDFIIARLPVPLTEREDELSSASASGSRGEAIQPFTKLRMARPGIARAVVEEGMVVVYHCMDNSREMFGAPNHPLEFELDDGPAIEMLLEAYPSSVAVMDLPHPSEELDDKVSVAQALFKEGFLLVDDNSSSEHQGGKDEDDDDGDCPF